MVDVLPAPGHHPAQSVYYDRNTGLVFSGDFLLPGRLLVDDWNSYEASAQRVAAFLYNKPVSFVLAGTSKRICPASYYPGNRRFIRRNMLYNSAKTICSSCLRR